MKCKCGNNQFFARQIVRVDVIVDGDGNFIDNAGKKRKDGSRDCKVYDSENPFGPFKCTEFGYTIKQIWDQFW